jgi:hypothetical protein
MPSFAGTAARSICHVADRHKREQRPITDENRGADGDERARLEKAKQQPRARVSEGDTLEHAEHADIGPLRLQASGVKKTDRKKQRAAEEHAFHGGSAAFTFDDLRQRKHERRARHEDKQRKNQVVEREPGPVLVIELVRDEAQRRDVADLGERGEQRIGAEYPKHVEATEGIEGDETR